MFFGLWNLPSALWTQYFCFAIDIMITDRTLTRNITSGLWSTVFPCTYKCWMSSNNPRYSKCHELWSWVNEDLRILSLSLSLSLSLFLSLSISLSIYISPNCFRLTCRHFNIPYTFHGLSKDFAQTFLCRILI